MCCVSGTALGRAPLIDPPTPPPCAADGICYPNTGRMGLLSGALAYLAWHAARTDAEPNRRPRTAASARSWARANRRRPIWKTPPRRPHRHVRARKRKQRGPGEGPPTRRRVANPRCRMFRLPDAESASPLGPTERSRSAAGTATFAVGYVAPPGRPRQHRSCEPASGVARVYERSAASAPWAQSASL